MRCKMTLASMTPDSGPRNLVFTPVYSGSPENEAFFKATPGGKIELFVVNEKAVEGLKVGGNYYVDFSPAE